MSEGDGYLKEVEMNLARGSKEDPREKSNLKCILKMRIFQMEENRTSIADWRNSGYKGMARQRECNLFEGHQAVQEGGMSVSQVTMVISKKGGWKV